MKEKIAVVLWERKVEAKLTPLGQAILLQKQLKSLEREATEKKAWLSEN